MAISKQDLGVPTSPDIVSIVELGGVDVTN